MNLRAGDRIGDYEVLGVLGAGGMGSVYKVRNVISDRVEALKLLLPNLAEHQDLKDRFLREIKTSASLEHPSIAGLRTAFQSGDMLLMVMEFVEGRTLDSMLKDGPLPIDDAVRYTVQVLDALEYAHSRGVVHRDIKPANVMVTPSGKAKLLDFGIAKASTDKQLTMTGTTLGSLYYMSPEQIRGEHVDARADLYSLGITLYELTTGKRPFGGDSGYAIMAEHLQKQPVPPVELDPRVPPALNAVILRSLAKSPADRYQDAAAFQNALKGAPTSAGMGVSNDVTAPRAAAPAPNMPTPHAAAPLPPTAPMPASPAAVPMPAQAASAQPQGANSYSKPSSSSEPAAYVPQKKPKNTLAIALVTAAAIMILAAVGLVIGASFFFGSSSTTAAASESPGILDRIAGMFSSKETAESAEKQAETATAEAGTESSPADEPDPSLSAQARAPISVDSITSEGGGAVSTAGSEASNPNSTTSSPARPANATAERNVSSAAANLATQRQPEARAPQTSSRDYAMPSPSSSGYGSGYGSTASPQAESTAPATPRVDPRVLEETQDFFAKLGIRAGTVQESARKLAQEQSNMGVSLRADIRASIKRMEYLMDQAEASLRASDMEKAKSQMAGAEREIEKLEKFFGI